MTDNEMGVTEHGAVEAMFHLALGRKGGKQVRPGQKPQPRRVGKTPRISKLVALAHHLEALLATGKVKDMTQIAALAQVKKARITQIMNLLYLKPAIQDELLHLPKTVWGKDIISERHVRPIAAELDWSVQERMWLELKELVGSLKEKGGQAYGGET